jgi:hypothetical protein
MTKPEIADDFRRLEILKLCSIRTGFFRQVDKFNGALNPPIVIRGDIRDEIGWMIFTNYSLTDLDFAAHVSTPQ